MVVCPHSLLRAVFGALGHSSHPSQDVRCDLEKTCTPWSSSSDPWGYPGAPETAPDTHTWADHPSLTVFYLTSLACMLLGKDLAPVQQCMCSLNMVIIPDLSKTNNHGHSEKKINLKMNLLKLLSRHFLTHATNKWKVMCNIQPDAPYNTCITVRKWSPPLSLCNMT